MQIAAAYRIFLRQIPAEGQGDPIHDKATLIFVGGGDQVPLVLNGLELS